VHEVSGHGRPSVATVPSGHPLTLSEEHGLLLRQVAARVEDLLAVIAEDRWPARELQALLAYLRAEVLGQAADEERLLFPTGDTPPAFAQLAADHTHLRLVTEALAEAADEGTQSPAQLAAATRDLVAHLERHLSAEEAVLAAAGGEDEAPGTTVLTTGQLPAGGVTGWRTS
jgi:iron-sulfur cluster repair protein YtfE (RIC family)